jgi:hypothetical protein
LLIRLETLTFIKTAPESLTIAFASMVFPVPGGPYNNTPFCGPKVSRVRRAQVSAEEEPPVHTKLS